MHNNNRQVAPMEPWLSGVPKSVDPNTVVEFDIILYDSDDPIYSFDLMRGDLVGFFHVMSDGKEFRCDGDLSGMSGRLPMALDFASKTRSIVASRPDSVPGLLLVSMAWSGIRCRESCRSDRCLFDEITKDLCEAIGDVFPEEGFAELVMSFVPPLLPHRLR